MVYGFPDRSAGQPSPFSSLAVLIPSQHLRIVQPVRAPVSDTARRRFVGMDRLHEMLVEDEILFCGLTLLFGIVSGAVSRLVAGLLGRRTA
jgi:hypothetical protein